MRRRYLVFGGDHYYPSGGWDDLVSAHHEHEQAVETARRYVAGNDYRWAQVVDAEKRALILRLDGRG